MEITAENCVRSPTDVGASSSIGMEKKVLFFIVLFAFGIRLFLMVYLQGYVIGDDWAFGYETGRIAKAIATDQGFSSPFREPSGPTAWMMPAYPYLLALIFKVFGVYTRAAAFSILLFNCTLAALTCIPVFLISRFVFGHGTAFIAALGWALYPPSIWHSINTIWDTSAFSFLCAFLIYGLYQFRDRSDFRNLALYGLLMGSVVMVNPAILSFLPFVWIWILRRPLRQTVWKFKGAALVTLALLLVISPWILRNYRQFDRFFLRSNLGLELKLGNNPVAWDDFQKSIRRSPWLYGHPSVIPEEFERFVALGETNYVDDAFKEAWTFIGDNPKKYVRLMLHRIRTFWISDLGVKNEWTGNLLISTSFPISLIKKLCHLVPLPFMVLGILVAIRKRLEITPLLAFALLFPTIYYFTHVSERYRFPIEPCILIFASYGLFLLVRRCKDGFTKDRSAGPETRRGIET